MRRFAVAETARVGVHLLLHRTVPAQRQTVIGAVVGDERIVERRDREVVFALEFFKCGTVLQTDLMFVTPEIVILGAEIQAQVGRVGREFVVDFKARVQWQAVFHFECQFAGARFRAGADDGIDLPVAAGVGEVKLALKNVRIQKHVRVQTRQGAHHVVGTEIAVAGDVDGRQPALRHLHLHGCVGQPLLRQVHGHGHKTAFAIRRLNAGQCCVNSVKRYVGAERAVNVRENLADGIRREKGVAGDQIFLHLDPGTGVRGNDVNPRVFCPGIQFGHLPAQGGQCLGHLFRAGLRCRKIARRWNGVGDFFPDIQPGQRLIQGGAGLGHRRGIGWHGFVMRRGRCRRVDLGDGGRNQGARRQRAGLHPRAAPAGRQPGR